MSFVIEWPYIEVVVDVKEVEFEQNTHETRHFILNLISDY